MVNQIERRAFLAGIGALGAGAVLAGCATSSPKGNGSGSGSGAISLYSFAVDDTSKKADAAVVSAFNAKGGAKVTLNEVPTETMRVQLPTYLTSQNPPDVMVWLAGSVARAYAAKGLLLDVSDVWSQSMTNYPQAIKDLCTYQDKQIFVPRDYYWWGLWYRKSSFAKWGVTPPKTWQDFLSVCGTLKGKGIAPVGIGSQGADAWSLTAWFDYFNIRINGATYHIDLLSGKGSLTDPKVVSVMNTWKQVLPFYDPQGLAIGYQQSFTKLAQEKVAMVLFGTSILASLPSDILGDMDFIQFPILDPSVPIAEEAPTDGVFASARTKNAASAKALMGFIGSAAGQQAYLEVYGSAGGLLPVSPDAKPASNDAVTQKGIKMLRDAKQLTQFYNRDSSDALQEPATAAVSQFVAEPQKMDSILKTWDAASKQIRASGQ